MGNHRGASCLYTRRCSVFDTPDTSSPQPTRFLEDRLSVTHRSEQIRRNEATSMQSHATGQTCGSISVFYNRWGNHRCAPAHAAEAGQVVGTVLTLVSVDFKDTTFVREWRSYEMPLSTWDVQISTGMQQKINQKHGQLPQQKKKTSSTFSAITNKMKTKLEMYRRTFKSRTMKENVFQRKK